MTNVWKLRPSSPSAPRLARDTGISVLQAQLLINRGISDTVSAFAFLSPRLSNLMDPMLLKDMDVATEVITDAIENRDNITIYGDYDADGLTAAALLLNFLSSLDIPLSFYIPNRLTEGYSLNPQAIGNIAKNGAGLIITVDCGTANRKEIELAIKLGLRVVVTDHHQLPEDFEPICPVINPHRPDSPFPFKNLSGVGLAFFLAIALRAALREKGWFKNRPEPDLKSYLDLVALGTVADMVPLLDQNRILVKWGTEIMRNSRWPGIKAIQEVSRMDTSGFTAYDLAFKLAPRINASGRMGHAELGIHALTTQSPSTARYLAGQLNSMNAQRQSIERQIIDYIEEQIISQRDLQNLRTLVFSGNGWHRGVLGIVAARLAEKYHRPTLVLDIENGMASGSGRSVEGFNLYKALARLGHLFEKFGGHDHAAGFTLRATNLETLTTDLEGIARRELPEESLIPRIEVDAEVSLSDLTLQTAREINALSPFGSGNPEPFLHAHSLEVIGSSVVGDNHLKLRIRQGDSVREAIGFGLGDKRPCKGTSVQMVFTPEINLWRGSEKIQLRVIDLEVMDHASKRLKLPAQS